MLFLLSNNEQSRETFTSRDLYNIFKPLFEGICLLSLRLDDYILFSLSLSVGIDIFNQFYCFLLYDILFYNL
jgi:hypothetical protein